MLDEVPINRISAFKKSVKERVKDKFSGITEKINNNKTLSSDDKERLTYFIQEITDSIVKEPDYADAGDNSQEN